MNNKIIICSGSVNIPVRLWGWAVCTIKEYNEELKELEWVTSQCQSYLNKDQLSYLQSEL